MECHNNRERAQGTERTALPITLEERLAVVNLYEELGSYRAVAAVVGCDHKTVKAWLERTGQGVAVAGVVRRRATDAFLHLIRERIEMTEGRLRGKRLLKLLRGAGYTASRRTLQRALRIEKRRWQERQRQVYRLWVSAPGDFLIVDWGEVGGVATAAGQRNHCFGAMVGWSRWRNVRFFTCRRFQVLAPGLAACFEKLGGVPARVMFDHPKTVTVDFVAGLSVLDAEMVRLGHSLPLHACHSGGIGPGIEGQGGGGSSLRDVEPGPGGGLHLSRGGEPGMQSAGARR